MRQNIFDMADEAAPEWAVIVRKGQEIKCRLKLRVNKDGELCRSYEWRLGNRRVKKENALLALFA